MYLYIGNISNFKFITYLFRNLKLNKKAYPPYLADGYAFYFNIFEDGTCTFPIIR